MPETDKLKQDSNWIEAKFEEDEQLEDNRDYVDSTINAYGDSGVSNELQLLET